MPNIEIMNGDISTEGAVWFFLPDINNFIDVSGIQKEIEKLKNYFAVSNTLTEEK